MKLTSTQRAHILHQAHNVRDNAPVLSAYIALHLYKDDDEQAAAFIVETNSCVVIATEWCGTGQYTSAELLASVTRRLSMMQVAIHEMNAWLSNPQNQLAAIKYIEGVTQIMREQKKTDEPQPKRKHTVGTIDPALFFSGEKS